MSEQAVKKMIDKAAKANKSDSRGETSAGANPADLLLVIGR